MVRKIFIFMILISFNIFASSKKENEVDNFRTSKEVRLDGKLFNAVIEGDLQNVKLLIKDGAWIDARNEQGLTPYLLSALHNQFNILKYFLEDQKVDVNTLDYNKANALILACYGDNIEMVKYLINHKINIKQEDINGIDSFLMSAYRGNLEILKYILHNIKKSKEFINKKKDVYGANALILASILGNKDVIIYLIEKYNLDVNSKDNYYYTPLHFASYSTDREMVKYLIDKKAKVNNQAKDGATPLTQAVRGGNLFIVKLLIEKGSDPNLGFIQDKVNKADTNTIIYRVLSAFDIAKELKRNDIESYLQNNRALSYSEIELNKR